jgi:hypothetical protein
MRSASFWNDDAREAFCSRVTPVRAHDPEKACPALYAGCEAVFRKDHARSFVDQASSCEEEQSMRKSILAVAVAFAISAPIAAQAQGEMTTGLARSGTVVVEGIDQEQLPAFREYVIREHIPNYSVPDRVIIGTVLPEDGVTFYDVPQTYGTTTYRYTVVNGRTVLVEPHTRRIVQIVE